MQQVDLIWHNGELVAWEDAKIHVLTHGLHYGTGVFEGERCYETADGPAIFRHREHLKRLLASAELYYMPVPYTLEELRAATHELIVRNGVSECYIRPIVYRGYGQMGLNPLDCEVSVSIAIWPWGAYLGDEAALRGVRAKVASWRRISSRFADPACEGVGPVPQQRARQDRGDEGRLRGIDPARLAGVCVRGHRRERVHGSRRRHLSRRPNRWHPRRDQSQVDHDDRGRPRPRGGRARHRPGRALPGGRGVPVGPPPSWCPSASSTTTPSARASPVR